jgi:hypothetical protein
MNNTEHINAFLLGWDAVALATPTKNPWMATSENADAFNLGFAARLHGIEREAAKTLHKSRGYTWKLNGRLWLSDAGECKPYGSDIAKGYASTQK